MNRRVIYLPTGMKYYSRRILFLTAGLLIAIIAAALTHSIAGQTSQPATGPRPALQLQATATPQPDSQEDKSEIGSTDGIVVMGVVIVLIVAVPIIVRRKHWMRQSTSS